MNLKPCAWSPTLTRLGPAYADERVWADGEPSARDLYFWQSEGESVTLAYHEKDVKALEAVLKMALHQAYNALNDLIMHCYDPDGNVKAPMRLDLMQARKILPPEFFYSLKKR